MQDFLRMEVSAFSIGSEAAVCITALAIMVSVGVPVDDKRSSKALVIEGRFTSFVFLTDQHLMTASINGDVVLWSLGKEGSVREENKMSFEGRLNCLMGISKTSECVIVKNERRLLCFSIQKKTTRVVAEIPSDVVSGVFMVEENVVLLGCADGAIRGYKLGDGTQTFFRRPTFASESPVPVHLALSKDGKRLAAVYDRITARRDCQIHVWDIRLSRRLCEFSGDLPLTAVFHPLRANLLFFPEKQDTLIVRDVSDCKIINEDHAFDARISGAVFSSDGKMLAVALANGSVLIEKEGGRRSIELHQDEGKATAVYQMSFSPSGRRLGVRLLGATNRMVVTDP